MLPLKIPEDGETQTRGAWLSQVQQEARFYAGRNVKDEKRTDKEVMHTFLFYVAAELIILTTSQSVKFRAVINKLLKKKE